VARQLRVSSEWIPSGKEGAREGGRKEATLLPVLFDSLLNLRGMMPDSRTACWIKLMI